MEYRGGVCYKHPHLKAGRSLAAGKHASSTHAILHTIQKQPGVLASGVQQVCVLCVCVCMCMYTHIYIYTYIYIGKYVHAYVYIYVYM